MSRIEALLVPMDGSPLSKEALEIALEEYPGATVTVLHVIDPTQPGYSYPIEFEPEMEPLHGSQAWYDRSKEIAEHLFEEARAIAAGYEADLVTEMVTGEPGREIVTYSETEDVDQVVIGSHGREDAQQRFLGSVTEAVVFRAPVRVLLVR